MKLKPLCHISIIVCATRTLPAMVGRPDGEEVMVAASAGEVQEEGEILPNYSSSVVGDLSVFPVLKIVCVPIKYLTGAFCSWVYETFPYS